MRGREQARVFARFWDWIQPGLIALEPGAMAYYAGLRDEGTRHRGSFDPGARRARVTDYQPARRNRFRPEESD